MAERKVICPFCGLNGSSEYGVQLHIEEQHTEDSSFAAKDNVKASPPGTDAPAEASSMLEEGWMQCTRPACGELIHVLDIDEHLELHEAIAASEAEERPTKSPGQAHKDRASAPAKNRSPRKHAGPHEQKTYRLQAPTQSGRSLFMDYFSGSSHHGSRPSTARYRPVSRPRTVGRLGKRELGPHAFEKTMPNHVRQRLVEDALPRHTNHIGADGKLYRESKVDNETPGLIDVISNLCASDPQTEAVYLCDPAVKHICKIRCDGNFCGYWNIQVLLSYFNSKAGVSAGLPNILQIQDIIEQAWDAGICTYGRIETGGIRGSRKWIGTHEAMAYFTQVGLNVEALSFCSDDGDDPIKTEGSRPVAADFLDHIEAYFISGLEMDGVRATGNAHITTLAPVYFQRLGHSMTIVGLERRLDGSRNLLVFDSSIATTEAVKKLAEGRQSTAAAASLLKPYRRK